MTIAAQNFEDIEKYDFKTVTLQISDKGPFTLVSNLQLEGFDAVIFTFNIRYLNLIKLLYKRTRNYKLILWGIGVSSENGYDNSSRFDFIRYWAVRKADAVVFYSEYPIEKYSKLGQVPLDKMFVANNTLALEANYFSDIKEYFLFVGTLKKYKQINKLVEVFHKAMLTYSKLPQLHIIGDGEFMQPLKAQISDLNLEEHIVLHGAITDPETLKHIYRKAIASISPYQAGLSVLQSLSMGVPFITNADAVTGGERFNIKHGYNGFLINSEGEFINLLIALGKDPSKVDQLSKNASDYFKKNCTLENMVNGFVEAVEK